MAQDPSIRRGSCPLPDASSFHPSRTIDHINNKKAWLRLKRFHSSHSIEKRRIISHWRLNLKSPKYNYYSLKSLISLTMRLKGQFFPLSVSDPSFLSPPNPFISVPNLRSQISVELKTSIAFNREEVICILYNNFPSGDKRYWRVRFLLLRTKEIWPHFAWNSNGANYNVLSDRASKMRQKKSALVSNLACQTHTQWP